MQKEPGIKWLFMDLNSYFASVEQQENPMLRGKPVAVVPMETDYTCAIAASYQAKAYGIKTGTMIKEAKQMCPALHCVLARHDQYVTYHHRVLEEVIQHTPINKVWSIDELDSRLPPSKRNTLSAQYIAQKIKDGLHKNIGECITCSIGFAPNSLLAKIACEMKKPNGLTILPQEGLQDSLSSLQLNDLPGIGTNMARRLRSANIHTVDALWNISPKHARRIWGNVQGERFWYMLHGYDIPQAEQNTSMVGHSRVLDPKLRHVKKAKPILRTLTVKAAQRLKEKGYYARNISLSVRTTLHHKWCKNLNIPPAQNPFEFLDHIDALWGNMLHDLTLLYDCSMEPLRLKKVSVTFHDLIEPRFITDDLFLKKCMANQESQTKREALNDALHLLQNKYKKNVVSLGLPAKTAAGYVGTKIAFSRVPDKKEFRS